MFGRDYANDQPICAVLLYLSAAWCRVFKATMQIFHLWMSVTRCPWFLNETMDSPPKIKPCLASLPGNLHTILIGEKDSAAWWNAKKPACKGNLDIDAHCKATQKQSWTPTHYVQHVVMVNLWICMHAWPPEKRYIRTRIPNCGLICMQHSSAHGCAIMIHIRNGVCCGVRLYHWLGT